MEKKIVDTEKLEHQLGKARDVQDFWRDNELNLREMTLAEFLQELLTAKGTQHLLHYAGAGALYVRDHWDSVLWYALEHRMGVVDTNLLLTELNLRALEL